MSAVDCSFQVVAAPPTVVEVTLPDGRKVELRMTQSVLLLTFDEAAQQPGGPIVLGITSQGCAYVRVMAAPAEATSDRSKLQ